MIGLILDALVEDIECEEDGLTELIYDGAEVDSIDGILYRC